MSRSYRKTPRGYCCGNRSGVGKHFKKTTNRRMRRHNKVRLQKDPEGFLPMILDEAGDLWESHKDHSWWFGHMKFGESKWGGSFSSTYEWVYDSEGNLASYYRRALTEEEIEAEKKDNKETYQRWMRK